jgi:hypothetical protein
MVTKLRLVGRHVDIDGAIVLAAFAGEAEIERFLDLTAPPTILDRAAMQHLEQHVTAATSRVPFLHCRHIARAHDTGIGGMPTTLADADTADRRPFEPAALSREMKPGLELWRPIIGSEAQV